MKNHFLLFFSIFVLVGLVSCSKKNDTVPEDPEYIQVKLGFGGEITIDQEPLTKGAATNHLYGIQVDFYKDGVYQGHYGYGLFDNTDDMVISLLSGYTYNFQCTMVYNGKNSLYYGQYGGNTYSGYAKPFQTNSATSTRLMNSFTLGASTYFTGIGSGIATLKASSGSSTDSNWPPIERYYGEYGGYAPAKNGSITIPLKKCFYGVKFILKGVENGTLSATMTYPSPGGTESFTTGGSDYDSGVLLRSFYDVRTCWQTEPNLSASVAWNFTSSLFNQWNLSGSKSITLKRNVLTTVTIEVTPDSNSGSTVISEEPLGDDNNINLFINGDGVIDIRIDTDPED